MIQQSSSSSLYYRRPLWAVPAWAGMSALWCCSSSISYADQGVAHPLRCPEGWFWRGCHGMWYAWALPPLTSDRSCISICTDVVRAVRHDLALFCGDFHSICCCSVYESAGEVLKFTIAAARKINVASRLNMGLPPLEMDVWWSWSVSCMIFSRNKLNRLGKRKHPWRDTYYCLEDLP